MDPAAQSSTPGAPRSRGIERRREKRYEVDLPGFVVWEDERSPVVLSDLSATGALINAELDLESGEVIDLEIEQFGIIEAMVVHAGAGFCGVRFVDAHRHRDRLLAWLREETGRS